MIRELAKTSHARRHAMCVDRSGGGGVRRVDKPGRTVARLSGAIARVGFGLALAESGARECEREFSARLYRADVVTNRNGHLRARLYILGNVVEAPPTPRSFACELE